MVRGNLTALVIASVFLLEMTGPAEAQDVVNPRWDSLPTPEDLGRAYPSLADGLGLPGWVQLRCTGRTDARLANCQVDEESPTGLGFGRAALSITPQFRLAPRQVDGDPSKSTVMFIVRFELEHDESGPIPWTGPEPSADRIEAARGLSSWMLHFKADFGPASLGVDADRAGPVESVLTSLQAEFAPRYAEAGALAAARILTREQIEAIIEGRPPPGKAPEEAAVYMAADQLVALNLEFRARFKAWYCGQYVCAMKAPPDLRRGANEPGN